MVAPENRPGLQEEMSFSNHQFLGQAVRFGEGNFFRELLIQGYDRSKLCLSRFLRRFFELLSSFKKD